MTKRRPIPQLWLEQYELGELSPERRALVEAELARLREAGEPDPLAALRSSNAEILRDYPSEREVADIQRRAARAAERPRSRAWLWTTIPVAATTAAVLLWINLADEQPTDTGPIARVDTDDPEVTRIKGGADAHLVIDRRRGEGHERLATGELVEAGDLLQLSYVPDGHRQGVILSIDGRGVVTLHHPSTPADPPTLAQGKEIALAHSYELDDAPAFERFVLITVTDEQPISVTEVLEAAERLAADPERAETELLPLAGERWQQSSLLVRKPGAPSKALAPEDPP